jgi:hypothetical protein|nr:MAG TPA: hypothetical protein [Caudoviricetes sp.]
MAKTFEEATKEAEDIFGNTENTESAENAESFDNAENGTPENAGENTVPDREVNSDGGNENTDTENSETTVGNGENAEQSAGAESIANREAETLDSAVNTAEAAAQELNRTSGELNQMREQNAALTEQIRQLSEQMRQMSQQQEESIVAETLEAPRLDINSLAFADENTVRNAEAEYAEKMAQYIRGGIMKEISPYIEQAREGKLRAERDKAFEGLSKMSELRGMADMRSKLDNIIANNKALSSDDIPDDEKYILAYTIARGVDAMNTPEPEPPKEMTPEEFLEKYKANEDYRKLIEQERVNSLKNSQQVPSFSASSGAVNAALNIPGKPKTWDEASERTRHAFR